MASDERPAPLAGGHPRVLLVEDEPSLALTLVDRLQSEGYEVESAEDGDTGFERALERPFDLILLDVALPGRGGFDVLRDLRQKKVDTPVLMLTARTQVVDRVLGLQAGSRRLPAQALRQAPRTDGGRAASTAGPSPGVRSGATPSATSEWISGVPRCHGAGTPSPWRPGRSPDPTVDVHVASLRQKVEPHPAKPEYIVTVHRMGYRFRG
jgi:two-component system alkaline phosphatase synthesis response regulator PhoP